MRIMCHRLWWALKRPLVFAAKNCLTQEKEMLSAVKQEDVHCEKQEEGSQVSCVQYSWVASNAVVSIVA